ncbi:cell growth regulator with EF hand domain protein 1 [Genypterus blacodes]|uniref:cell growth regulator with EF hand domain protein 1 n=1 Tax=Genypterus blacodes TaxID=154954 RepID=UPI003F76C1A3
MQTGVLMDPHLGRLFPRVLAVLLLIHICLAAPGLTASQREASVVVPPPSLGLANPFGSTEEDRGLLHSFVQSSLKDGQGEPEISTWEQEVFFLFGLHDYDRSGFLDGLEMMKLLSDFNSHNVPAVQTNAVVSMVDFLLQTQDLNEDGLLAPSELLSPPLPHTQDSSNSTAPHQEQEGMIEENLPNPNTEVEEEKAAALEEKEKAHEEEQQAKEEETPEHEVKTKEEEVLQNEEHKQEVPVHQGQPEM